MIIDKIVTLANRKTEIRFRAMERSLRAVGCELPIWVIPYDDNLFDLPANSVWWRVEEVLNWLKEFAAHPMMRKYQCLTIKNYQFVDSDVIFLQNPQFFLQPFSGFITSCGHWHNPDHTYTNSTLEILKNKSTIWQSKIFNAGQFACDTVLYDFQRLKLTAEAPSHIDSVIRFRFHDQPGLNLLVNLSNISIENVTLPPYNFQSSWAGDYKQQGYVDYWSTGKQNYLIHWAGCSFEEERAIDQLFYQYLTPNERAEFTSSVLQRKRESRAVITLFKQKARQIRTALKLVFARV